LLQVDGLIGVKADAFALNQLTSNVYTKTEVRWERKAASLRFPRHSCWC
jgi:hypothetical protein